MEGEIEADKERGIMEDILLSVVVPVYNAEKYLNRCIDSILNQTYKNLEIICVDDGSTDHSGMILDKYAESDRRINVIHTANKGSVSARKTGILAATGKYVTCVDSDDWIEKNMYQEMMEVAVEYDVDIIASGFIRDYVTYVFHDVEKAKPGYYEREELKKEIISKMIDRKNPFFFLLSPSLCNKICKLDMLLRFHKDVPDEVTIDDDTVVAVPMLMGAKKIYVCDKSYYHYCSRLDSQMNKKGNAEEYSYRLGVAYGYLRKILDRSICDYYETYARLQMCPETVLSYKNGVLSHFGSLSRKARIIVYGAGSFGKSIRRYLMENGFNVIAWVDKSGDGTEIITPESIVDLEYDVIVVGVLLSEITDNIYESLIGMGVPKEKVYRIHG